MKVPTTSPSATAYRNTLGQGQGRLLGIGDGAGDGTGLASGKLVAVNNTFITSFFRDFYFRTVQAYSLERDKSFPITDGMSDASEPVFDSSGKYLYSQTKIDDMGFGVSDAFGAPVPNAWWIPRSAGVTMNGQHEISESVPNSSPNSGGGVP